jgi:hypothetical protein
MWEEKLPTFFGVVDKRFGGQPVERRNASDMLRDAIDAGASVEDIEKAVKRVRDLACYLD